MSECCRFPEGAYVIADRHVRQVPGMSWSLGCDGEAPSQPERVTIIEWEGHLELPIQVRCGPMYGRDHANTQRDARAP